MSALSTLILLGLTVCTPGGQPTHADQTNPACTAESAGIIRLPLALADTTPVADDDGEMDESSERQPGNISISFCVRFSGSRWHIGGHWTRSEPFFFQMPLGYFTCMQVRIVMPSEKADADEAHS